MPNTLRYARTPFAIVLALMAAGCSCESLRSAAVPEARLSIKDSPPRVRAASRAPKAKQSRPDADLRRFRGERHLKFQARTLRETPEQMTTNNASCRRTLCTRQGRLTYAP